MSPALNGTTGKHPGPVSGRIAGYPTTATRAPGDRSLISSSASATFEAVPSIRPVSSSSPPLEKSPQAAPARFVDETVAHAG